VVNARDGFDEIRKGNALIRHVFGVDPKGLSDEEWAERVQEAVWLMGITN